MIIQSALGNLGDNLWLTPLFVNGFANKLILPDDEKCRMIGRLFDGLCDVEYLNSDKHCPESTDRIHRAAAHMKYFGLNGSCIPFVKIKESEIIEAKNILNGIKNPIAVNFTTANAGGDQCSASRCMDENQQKFIIDALIKNGFTPVNIGLSSNTKIIDGVVNILDLDIRLTAACYKLIGKYIGTESGPPNLMLSVGGRILVYHPEPDDLMYPAWKYHFTEEYWQSEKCRAKYVNFSKLYEIDNDLNFFL